MVNTLLTGKVLARESILLILNRKDGGYPQLGDGKGIYYAHIARDWTLLSLDEVSDYLLWPRLKRVERKIFSVPEDQKQHAFCGYEQLNGIRGEYLEIWYDEGPLKRGIHLQVRPVANS